MTSFRALFFRGKPDAGYSRAKRSGKKSNHELAHERFKFIRILFVLGIAGLLVLLTGLIITLGPLDISVLDSYSALLARFWPEHFYVDELTSRGLEHPLSQNPGRNHGRLWAGDMRLRDAGCA